MEAYFRQRLRPTPPTSTPDAVEDVSMCQSRRRFALDFDLDDNNNFAAVATGPNDLHCAGANGNGKVMATATKTSRLTSPYVPDHHVRILCVEGGQ
jgi:hypothetical protein